MNDRRIMQPPTRLAEALRRRGWTETYRDEAFLKECIDVLGTEYLLTDVWREAVAKFGGYSFTWGGERGLGAVTIDPMEFAGDVDSFLIYSAECGKPLIPFAAVERNVFPFAIDADGGGYLITGQYHYWPDFLLGIDSKIFGGRCSCQTCR